MLNLCSHWLHKFSIKILIYYRSESFRRIFIIEHHHIIYVSSTYTFLSFMDGFSTFLRKLLLVSKENRNFAATIETLMT